MASHLFDKATLSKLRFTSGNKTRPIRIMVIGQRGVGKTAMVVRFITRRFIGDYDSSTDKVYTYSTFIDNEMMTFEIIDSPGVRNPGADDSESISHPPSAVASNGQPNGVPATTSTTTSTTASSNDHHHQSTASTPDADLSALEKHIQNADAFIIMYSVTDQCSFDDCNRLRFLINYNNKQRRRSISKDCALDIPVILVGNKKDQRDDRMVDVQQGRQMYRQMSCAGFHEISVRESVEEVMDVFRDLCRCWRIFTHYPKLRRSTSDAQTISYMLLSPDVGAMGLGMLNGMGNGMGNGTQAKRSSIFGFRSNSSASAQQSPSAEDVNGPAATTAHKKLSFRLNAAHQTGQAQQPFRERAATDGKILSRPRKWQYMSAAAAAAAAASASQQQQQQPPPPKRLERRMSISQRGSSGN